jgi:hypothetical protein
MQEARVAMCRTDGFLILSGVFLPLMHLFDKGPSEILVVGTLLLSRTSDLLCH